MINEISLVYNQRVCSIKQVSCSDDAANAAREFFQKNDNQITLKEYFYIILLNRANRIIGYHKLSEGGISGTFVDIRLAFATALKSVASGIILVHNHPSGSRYASESDLSLTRKFHQAGKILEIEVLDHIILTESDYYSFADDDRMK